MHFLRIILLAGVFSALCGCAGYKYTTTFFVRNQSATTLTVRVDGDSEDANFTIEPGHQRAVHVESTKCPEDFVPIDKYTADDLLPPPGMIAGMEIWVGSTLLDSDISRRINWNRTATVYSEVYTLPVTDELTSEYGGF